MSIFLLLIPIFAIISSLSIYKHNGKREFLKFDLVQFIYAFVIAPVLFVWMKTFIFYLLRSDADLSLTMNQIYLIDTVFSVFAFYVYAFVVIHSLTASFQRKVLRDPLWDVFYHSEYFHLWLTHLVMGVGSMILLGVVSMINIISPLDIVSNRFGFYITLLVGIIAGIVIFMGIWLSDPKQRASFMRIMKLVFGFFFLSHVLVYFLFTPELSTKYLIYWCNLMIFSTTIVCSLFFHRNEKTLKWYEKLKFLDWGVNNVNLFGKKK